MSTFIILFECIIVLDVITGTNLVRFSGYLFKGFADNNVRTVSIGWLFIESDNFLNVNFGACVAAGGWWLGGSVTGGNSSTCDAFVFLDVEFC